MSDEDDSLLVEGSVPWAETGVSLSALRTDGYFAEVTPKHEAKARAYWARIGGRRDAARQGDLFGGGHGA